MGLKGDAQDTMHALWVQWVLDLGVQRAKDPYYHNRMICEFNTMASWAMPRFDRTLFWFDWASLCQSFNFYLTKLVHLNSILDGTDKILICHSIECHIKQQYPLLLPVRNFRPCLDGKEKEVLMYEKCENWGTKLTKLKIRVLIKEKKCQNSKHKNRKSTRGFE